MKYKAFEVTAEGSMPLCELAGTTVDLTGETVPTYGPREWANLDKAYEFCSGWMKSRDTDSIMIVEIEADGSKLEIMMLDLMLWQMKANRLLNDDYGVSWEDGFGEYYFDLHQVTNKTPSEAVREYAEDHDLEIIGSITGI